MNKKKKKKGKAPVYWYGVKGVTMIWHGEWSDPELKIQRGFLNYICNYFTIEDYFYSIFRDENPDCEEWTESELDKKFSEFLQERKSDVYALIKECGTAEKASAF